LLVGENRRGFTRGWGYPRGELGVVLVIVLVLFFPYDLVQNERASVRFRAVLSRIALGLTLQRSKRLGLRVELAVH
jgi:hypothetical protein